MNTQQISDAAKEVQSIGADIESLVRLDIEFNKPHDMLDSGCAGFVEKSMSGRYGNAVPRFTEADGKVLERVLQNGVLSLIREAISEKRLRMLDAAQRCAEVAKGVDKDSLVEQVEVHP